MQKKYLLVISILFFTSCNTFREVHFFKDKIKDEYSSSPTSLVPNYYKVEIKGWSFMSSSRYLSGYFDQNAVNEYFNEISQPENGILFVSKNKVGNNNEPSADEQQNVTSNDATASDNLQNCDDSSNRTGLKESGSELVLILSTNSEAVATQIKNTAVNKDVLKSLTLLASKDKMEESKEISRNVESINSEISLFLLKVDGYINSLDKDSATDNDKELIFQFLKSELKELGVNKEFDTFNEIKNWYEDN